MSDDLSPEHAAFVTEYMVDENANAAAKRAGFKTREVARLMTNPAIAAEIARRRAAAAPEPTPVDTEVSVETLIREADEAYEVAKKESSAAGMVAASQLKAKLTGRLAGGTAAGADEAEAEPPAVRDLSRAVQAAINDELPPGWRMKLVPPGMKVVVLPESECVLRVRDATTARMLGEQFPEACELDIDLEALPPRLTLDNAKAHDPLHPAHRRLGGRTSHGQEFPGDRETLPNNFSISFDAFEDNGKLKSRWTIVDPEGMTRGYRLTREEAVAAANDLAELRQ